MKVKNLKTGDIYDLTPDEYKRYAAAGIPVHALESEKPAEIPDVLKPKK